MEKKKIILPRLRYEKAQDEDSQIYVGFDEEKTILREDDRNIVLDLSEQFKYERSICNRYKIYGKMRIIFRNLYYGIGIYKNLEEKLALKGDGSDGNFDGYLPYNEFAFLRTDIDREIITGETMSSLSGFTGFIPTINETNPHERITALSAPKYNWNLYLTYVYSHDSSYPMKYTLSGSTDPLSFVSGDGIPFRVTTGSTTYSLTSPVKHGMNQGEYVIINGTPYYINSVGDELYDSEKYTITILKSQLLSGTTFSLLITGKRCTDANNITGSTSEYYIHKHKTVTTVDDYIIDKVGFESTIFEDEKKIVFETSTGTNDVIVERNKMESILFDFKEPFSLTGITNNLGYTPVEVYVTTIFRNGNGYFDYPPKVGYSFNMHDSWIDAHFSGSTSNETSLTSTSFIKEGITFYSGNTLDIGSILCGAFVEYNPKEMKERIISESSHKIISNINVFDHNQTGSTIYSGASIDNPIGLYYQTHYRVKLRELSPYTETFDTDKIDNLPENARYFEDEKLWRWRDLYDDGYIDTDGYGTDYPYMNDMHYVHKDINFYLRNEKAFTTKKDGIISFYLNNKRNKIIC